MASALGFASSPARAEPTRDQPRTFSQQFFGPMQFTLGRLPGTRPCGLDCVDFVVADGMIMPTSSFFYLLATRALGERKVPVLVDSPGGIRAGMSLLAHAWRKFGVTIIIARAREVPCGEAGAPACNPADKAARVKVFRVSGARGECASACPFTILGAVTRVVPPGARVAIHSPHLDTSEGLGKFLAEVAPNAIKREAKEDVEDFGAFAEHYGGLRILAERMVKTPPAKLDYLSPEDVVAYRIATAPPDKAGLAPSLLRAITPGPARGSTRRTR